MPAGGQLVTIPFRAWSQALAPSMWGGGCQVFCWTAQGSLQRAPPIQQGKGGIPSAPLHGQLSSAGRWGQPARLPYWSHCHLSPVTSSGISSTAATASPFHSFQEGKADGNMGYLLPEPYNLHDKTTVSIWHLIHFPECCHCGLNREGKGSLSFGTWARSCLFREPEQSWNVSFSGRYGSECRIRQGRVMSTLVPCPLLWSKPFQDFLQSKALSDNSNCINVPLGLGTPY